MRKKESGPMDFHYEINHANETERWLLIHHDPWDEPDAFFHLLNTIRDDCRGTICEVGYLQYKINGARLDLIYQYDDLFGSVVIYPETCTKEQAAEFLNTYF